MSTPKSADLIDLERRAAELGRARKSESDSEDERCRTRVQVAGIIVTAVLVGVGWLLVQGLAKNASAEDCLMQGRSNCVPLIAPSSAR